MEYFAGDSSGTRPRATNFLVAESWIRANVNIPPHGFHDGTCQCIGCGICDEDEVEALRVPAGHRDRAGQIDESPRNPTAAKRIRKGRRDVDAPDHDNECAQNGPNGDSAFHAVSPFASRSNYPPDTAVLVDDRGAGDLKATHCIRFRP
jgi:hypothetical protein